MDWLPIPFFRSSKIVFEYFLIYWFFILVEIQKETISKNKTLINLENIKNQHIKKYSNTILDLRKNGMGSQSIEKYLYENHRVKVSRGTIEKFYKQNGL